MVDLSGLFKFAANAEKFASGEVVFHQGDKASAMYIVREGELDIFINGKWIETVSAGTTVGESSLVDNATHSTTVVAKTDAVLVPISRERFMFMVQETPNFALWVMHILADRLRCRSAALV